MVCGEEVDIAIDVEAGTRAGVGTGDAFGLLTDMKWDGDSSIGSGKSGLTEHMWVSRSEKFARHWPTRSPPL